MFNPEKEAGFYTTRFGRLDPSMAGPRLAELRTRFMEPVEAMDRVEERVPAWEVAEEQGVELPLGCVWSVRSKAFLCREASPW